MQYNKWIKVFFLLIATYILLYLLGEFTPLHNWGFSWNFSRLDYTVWLMPLIGFSFMYLLVGWVDEYFKAKVARSPIFPVVFAVLSLAAFYLNVWWYWRNVAELSGLSDVPFDFWGLLLDSAFLVFALASVCGWASRMAIEHMEKQ